MVSRIRRYWLVSDGPGVVLESEELRRGAGVVELACLENKCALTGTEGSNPSLSAKLK